MYVDLLSLDLMNFPIFLQVPQVVLPLTYQAMVNPLIPTGPTSRVRTRGSSRWTRCQKRAPTRARTPTPTMASVTPPRLAPPQPHRDQGPRVHPHQIQHQGQVGYGVYNSGVQKQLKFIKKKNLTPNTPLIHTSFTYSKLNMDEICGLKSHLSYIHHTKCY